MKLRNILFGVIAVMLLLAGGLIGTYKYRQFQQRDLERRVERTRTTGTITYRCSDRWVSVDYDPKTVGPPVLNLIVQHVPRTRRSVWSVQRAGSLPITASTFTADTHSIGGSRGLRWREADGREMAATLSFSDIIGEYGPQTIWVQLYQQHDAHQSQSVGVSPGLGKLVCGPDPASYRP